MHKARNIDGDHAFRSAGSYIEVRFIRRYGHAKRLRCVAVQFVERNFHRLAHVGAKDCQRVGEGSAVFQVRQRYQILGMKLGYRAEPPVCGESNVKYAGNGMQRNSIDNIVALRINDRDLGFRRRTIFEACPQRRRIWINMCRINPLAIGRESEITRAAAGDQPLFLCSGLRI